jgi:nucleoside-diphosphate-sugar epimerase
MKPSFVLESADVKTIAAAAEAEALANHWAVTIAIVDAGGHLLHLQRLDGAPPISAHIPPAHAPVIPQFLKRALSGGSLVIHGSGRQSRDFVYVGDVVRANLLAAQAPQAPGRALHVCTGIEISLLDLLTALYALIPAAPPAQFADPRPGDIYRSLGSPALAAQVLGFHAQTTLSEGLHQTLEWMRHETPHLPA